MTRAENVLNTVMQSFAITCLISMLWFMMGYSLAFGNGLNVFSEQAMSASFVHQYPDYADMGLK